LRGEWNPVPGISLGERELADHRAYVSGSVWNHLSCRMEDVPVPEPKEDEVLIKVGACGVCGSDIHSISKLMILRRNTETSWRHLRQGLWRNQ
jgi:hypothetical protein